MAVNFSPLLQVPSIGQSFMAGQQAAQQQVEQNRLRQMQEMQMEAQRENMLAQREQRIAMAGEREAATQERAMRLQRARQADEYLAKVSDLFAQNNTPLTPETAQQGLAFAIRSGDKNAIEMMSKTVQAMREQAAYEQERSRLGLGAPGATVNREQVQNMLMSSNPQIMAQGKALAGTLPKEPSTPADLATMRALGIPETEAGYAKFKGMSRPVTNVTVPVNAYVPASQAAQSDYIKAAGEERKVLRTAPDTLKNIDAAKKLIPGASAFMGKGGEPLMAAASFLNNRLGFNIATQGVTDATVLRTRLFEGILDNLKKLDSQPSQEQQRVLAEALGNLGTDPQALVQILDRIGETVRDRVDRYNTDVTEAEQRGVKFPYKPQIKLPESARPAPGIPAAAPAAGQPIYARNPTTGQRIMSVDGGNTWTPAR